MERAIATQQTGWSFVSQSRADLPDPVGGVLWFGTDDTNTSVYMPFYCSMTEVPLQLAPGDINNFSFDSNFWMNTWVANQAYERYDRMIPDIRKVQGKLEGNISLQDPRKRRNSQTSTTKGTGMPFATASTKKGRRLRKRPPMPIATSPYTFL